MGVKDLLPFVEKATRQANVSEFQGSRVAIDVNCLLHRSVFGCMEKVAQGHDTDFCIQYVEKYVNLFHYYRCQVTLVFDGQPLPAKKDVTDSRNQKREDNRKLGTELLNNGHAEKALTIFKQGIGLPGKITRDTIRHFSTMKGVGVIVAPYEADAQLAYLLKQGFVDIVVTEDSDLIVFGCQKIIYKLDANGSCMLFEADKLKNCMDRPFSYKFDFTIFRRMCILAGCDYLNGGLDGVGLRRAQTFFAKIPGNDPKKFLPKVPGILKTRGTVDIRFIEQFIRAENTFLHQIVYDPRMQVQLPLTPYPNTDLKQFQEISQDILEISHKFRYAGKIASPEEAKNLANGGLASSTSQSATS